jgi:hypothetical protein
LAVEERELRFARRRLESLIEQRATTVALVSALGMTRREVGEVTGLSTGRVQQVLDDASPVLRAQVNRWLSDALHVLRDIGARSVPRGSVSLPPGSEVTLLDELADCGLISEDAGQLSVTEAGERAELHLRGAKSRKSARRG